MVNKVLPTSSLIRPGHHESPMASMHERYVLISDTATFKPTSLIRIFVINLQSPFDRQHTHICQTICRARSLAHTVVVAGRVHLGHHHSAGAVLVACECDQVRSPRLALLAVVTHHHSCTVLASPLPSRSTAYTGIALCISAHL